ncbi:MAG: DUF4256 domain-containing protein [Spartobacteria bacterium]
MTPKSERENFLKQLESRFEKNMTRHPGMEWVRVLEALEASPEKLRTLSEMERTGGEPDLVWIDGRTGAFVFCDCSPETPDGRVNFCYDRAGMDSRKQHKPANNACDAAAAMGVELLTEDEYFALQKLGEFDRKASSWLQTPEDIRRLGGAIFGDRRFGRVFIYHNGAASYFSSRGFRGLVRI